MKFEGKAMCDTEYRSQHFLLEFISHLLNPQYKQWEKHGLKEQHHFLLFTYLKVLISMAYLINAFNRC